MQTGQIIFHIDVNSAYLSWSALKNLADGSEIDLREVPSIIGGDMEKRHGVVLAKSIPAKAYHVTTGEPIVNALRKCPHLIMESPDHRLYHRRSEELMAFLSDICPDIEQVSVDECYMDYTPVDLRQESTGKNGFRFQKAGFGAYPLPQRNPGEDVGSSRIFIIYVRPFQRRDTAEAGNTYHRGFGKCQA